MLETLTLNGSGYNNLGALENVSGFNDTWAAPVTLGSNASVSVDGAGDTLTLNQPIGDGGQGFGLTKVGPGTLDDAGTPRPKHLHRLDPGLPGHPVAGQECHLGSAIGHRPWYEWDVYLDLQRPDDQPGPGLQRVSHRGDPQRAGGTQQPVHHRRRGRLCNGEPHRDRYLRNAYTITFGGSLANANQPPITAAGFNGATPIVGILTPGTPGGAAAFGGNLTIGTGLAGNTAVAKWIGPNEVPDTATVTVNSDGTLNLNGQADTIGRSLLVLIDGQATTCTQRYTPTVSSVNMTGGTITLANAGSQLVLAGTTPGLSADVTATSDVTSPATITGPAVPSSC